MKKIPMLFNMIFEDGKRGAVGVDFTTFNRMKNVRYSNCSEHSGSSLQSRARLTSPSTSNDTVG